MFDTLTIARRLTEAGIDRDHAAAITDAVRQAAEHGDHATRADLVALRTELRADLAALEARVYRAMPLQAGAIVAAVAGLLRLLDGSS